MALPHAGRTVRHRLLHCHLHNRRSGRIHVFSRGREDGSKGSRQGAGIKRQTRGGTLDSDLPRVYSPRADSPDRQCSSACGLSLRGRVQSVWIPPGDAPTSYDSAADHDAALPAAAASSCPMRSRIRATASILWPGSCSSWDHGDGSGNARRATCPTSAITTSGHRIGSSSTIMEAAAVQDVSHAYGKGVHDRDGLDTERLRAEHHTSHREEIFRG